VTKSPGTWKARHFVDAIIECRPAAVTVETVDETILPRGERIRAGSCDEVLFSLATSYLSVGPRGRARKGWSSVRPEAQWPCKRVKGNKGNVESC
jgi:hypothetical protein